ncbi:MAG: hypothetical protein J6A75_11630 [Lachnospiraceae bacterium]|nr:hypothetical protein [Lachnospiraceae bacterium]
MNREFKNMNKEIPAEQLAGRRKVYAEERAYVKSLMLSYTESSGAKTIFWIIVLAMIVLPLCGVKALMEAVFGGNALNILQLTDVIVELAVCVVLTAISICGIMVMCKEIKKAACDTVKKDLLKECFYVVDVEIVAYHRSSNMESSEVLATVRDCNGNVADKPFTTSNWREIDKTKNGWIVLTGEGNKKTVLYRVIPRYNADSKFCQKYSN